MPKNRTFIHIGCHKAGSTFVQEELLQKLKNIKPITFFNKNEYLEKEFCIFLNVQIFIMRVM